MEALSVRELSLAMAAVVVCSAECSAQQSTIAWARVRLEGPLSGLSVSAAGGTTRSARQWLAGESETLLMPLALESDAPRREPRIEWDVGDPTQTSERGRARFEGWEGPKAEPLARVPLALRSRPPAPLDQPELALGPARLVLLGGILILSVAFRGSRRILLSLALLGAAAAWLTGPRTGAPSVRERSVLEGLAGGTPWMSVRTVDGRHGLRLSEPGQACALDAARPGARLVISERGGAWYAETTGLLHERLVLEAPEHLPAMSEVWRREDGNWTYRGHWSDPEVLPPARPGPPPPGWLASGLPQGVGITLGRIEGESWLCVSDP